MSDFNRSWEFLTGPLSLFVNGASDLLIKHVSHAFNNVGDEIGLVTVFLNFVLKLCGQFLGDYRFFFSVELNVAKSS